MGTGKCFADVGIAKLLTVVLSLAFTIVGCESSDHRKLVEDFPKYETSLNKARELILALHASVQLTGYIVEENGHDSIVLNKHDVVELEQAYTIKTGPAFSDVLRLKETLRKLTADNAHVSDQSDLTIVMRGGGVLGADIGYAYLTSPPLTPIAGKTKYFPIPSDVHWYVFVH
ncbi:MAG: hypothetical protein KF814_01535 [Nitrospiraceae bacterium]|nr:hypothetical protein [Nitrospiraceae bacterium]